MAQIKNIKKPGDLIRGAKIGVAGLDKDGNVVGTGIDTEDIAIYPESGSEGDVLTLGETGPEWAPPSGGSSLYMHNLTVYSASSPFLSFSAVIISNDSTVMSSTAFHNYLKINHPRTTTSPNRHPMACRGTIVASDGSLFIANMIENHPDDDDVIITGMSVNLTNNTISSGESLVGWSRFSGIIDIVVPIGG